MSQLNIALDWFQGTRSSSKMVYQNLHRASLAHKLLLVATALMLVVVAVDAQRAVTSLGARWKKLQNRNRSSRKKDSDGYVIEGEVERKQLQGLIIYLSFLFQEHTEIFVSGVVLVVTILLSLWRGSSMEKDGECMMSQIVLCCAVNSLKDSSLRFISPKLTKWLLSMRR